MAVLVAEIFHDYDEADCLADWANLEARGKRGMRSLTLGVT